MVPSTDACQMGPQRTSLARKGTNAMSNKLELLQEALLARRRCVLPLARRRSFATLPARRRVLEAGHARWPRTGLLGLA